MRTIAVVNQKGGVGKTTSVVNIGAGLTRLGYSVLLIDLDPQSHLTLSLSVEPDETRATMFDVLSDSAKLHQAIVDVEGMHLVPASLDLAQVDAVFSATSNWEFLLADALVDLPPVDFLLFDCPPNLGLLTVMSLCAAREVFIPLQPEFLALHGLGKLAETVGAVKQRLNPPLEITGIIATRYQKRKKLNREVIVKIREYFGDILFTTKIRDNIAVAEAPSFGQDIFRYSPHSNGALDYINLCREIAAQSGRNDMSAP
ncbi:ParA family protein [Desulfovibrio inopinatus]|uniref:ParA family protein n=1 Tax=Desulfovibrio inopinatus TaxID=102109 RepID=UPI000423650F|nr:ParA family protein [Desulfovibrio inopinatus]